MPKLQAETTFLFNNETDFLKNKISGQSSENVRQATRFLIYERNLLSRKMPFRQCLDKTEATFFKWLPSAIFARHELIENIQQPVAREGSF